MAVPPNCVPMLRLPIENAVQIVACCDDDKRVESLFHVDTNVQAQDGEAGNMVRSLPSF